MGAFVYPRGHLPVNQAIIVYGPELGVCIPQRAFARVQEQSSTRASYEICYTEGHSSVKTGHKRFKLFGFCTF